MSRQLKLKLGADPEEELRGKVTEKQKDGIEKALTEMMLAYGAMLKREEPHDEKRKD